MKSHSDRLLHALDIGEQIDCTGCANNCKAAKVRLSEGDIERLALTCEFRARGFSPTTRRIATCIRNVFRVPADQFR